MKKLILFLMLLSVHSFGQIGINTNTPITTLDVEGDLRVSKTKELTETPKYILSIDKDNVLRTVLRSSLGIDSSSKYSPKFAGTFRSIQSFSCKCEKKSILFDDINTINEEYLQENDDATFTIMSDGTYQFTIQVGVNNATANSNIKIGLLNKDKNWLGEATFSTPNSGKHFKIYTTTLVFKKGDIFSVGINSDANIVVQGAQNQTQASDDVTKFSVIKFN